MSKAPEITASELVLSAIFLLQQKNGVTEAEITKFVCDKRRCRPATVKGQVKKALDRAIRNGIFSKKKGLYRIENSFGNQLSSASQEGGREKWKGRKGKRSVRTKRVRLFLPYGEGSSRREKKMHQSGMLGNGYYPCQMFRLVKNEMSTVADHSSSNESEGRAVSLMKVKREVAKDNEEDEDDDYIEEDDDDDEVDYFADESKSNSNKVSREWGRNYSSESDLEEKNRRKKRKESESKEVLNKRKRTSERNSDAKDAKRTRGKKKSAESPPKQRRGRKGNKRQEKEVRKSPESESVESGLSGDSDEGNRETDEFNEKYEEDQESENNGDSESEKSVGKRSECISRSGEGPESTDRRSDFVKEVKEHIKSNNDFQKQSKTESNAEAQKSTHQPLQNADLTEENKKAVDPQGEIQVEMKQSQDFKDGGKKNQGEPPPTVVQGPQVPLSSGSKEHHGPSKRETSAKLMRTSRRKNIDKKKKTSHRKSNKNNRRK